jgi:tetratricopeptide (TPR) repeat protein
MRWLAFLLASAALLAQSEELVRQSQRGKQLMAEGRFADAVPVYQQMVKALPDNPGLLLNLAMAERMAGQTRQAIGHFEAVLKLQPRNLPALVSLGAAHLELDEARAAIDPLQKAVAMETGNRDARVMLAGALFALERFEPAAEQYRALARMTPDDPQVWLSLGRSYESLARQAFRELEKLAPKSGYMAALLADTRLQRRQYRSAFFLYRQTLDQLPGLARIHASIAEVYRRTDHADWAAAEERKEKSLTPPDCAAHAAACHFLAGRGLEALAAAKLRISPEGLFWQSKAYDEMARQAYGQLGKLPESPQIHEVKAAILRGQGQAMESAAEWRAALRLAPDNPQYERELANSLYLAGDYKNALPMIEQFLKSEPESAQWNLLQGDSLLHLEEVEKSVPYLQKAVLRDPRLLPAQASLGLAESRAGKSAEAIPHLEAALVLDADGSLHYQLARAYQAAGLAEKAQKAMSEYQQIQKKAQADKEELAKEMEIAPPK